MADQAQRSESLLRCYDIDIDSGSSDVRDSTLRDTVLERGTSMGLYEKMYGAPCQSTAGVKLSRSLDAADTTPMSSNTSYARFRAANATPLSICPYSTAMTHIDDRASIAPSKAIYKTAPTNISTAQQPSADWRSSECSNNTFVGFIGDRRSPSVSGREPFKSSTSSPYCSAYNDGRGSMLRTNVVAPFNFRGTEMRFIDDDPHGGEGSNVLVDNDECRSYPTADDRQSDANSLVLPRIGRIPNDEPTPLTILPSQKMTVSKMKYTAKLSHANPSNESTRRAPPIGRLCRSQTTMAKAESRVRLPADYLKPTAQWCAPTSIDAKVLAASTDKGCMGFSRTISSASANNTTASLTNDTPAILKWRSNYCTSTESSLGRTSPLEKHHNSSVENIYQETKPYVGSISDITRLSSASGKSFGKDQDDTGIDSSHSTTSSVDYRERRRVNDRKETTSKDDKTPPPSSYYSSMDSLQIERSPTASSMGQTSPAAPANAVNWLPPIQPLRSVATPAAAVSTKPFETNANVIRRKLSAHSKMKGKRTSTQLTSGMTSDNNNNNLDSKEMHNNKSLVVNEQLKDAGLDPNNLSDGDTYDSSAEDQEHLNDNIGSGRSSLVVRQQPGLRVKAIIDKLLYMSGRDQRRALFSLKSIFQNDKDIVHEFVRNGGLECLVKIGRTSDHNHQNHILRAIGQLMLYVDGMNGIIASSDTICWLYELLDSPYRLVVKTALKLLLVFVEYTESNSLLLLAAISRVEKSRGRPEWCSVMRILNDHQASDEETLVFGMTVVNKTLNGIPDQDTFFDIVDVLENQGMEDALKAMLRMNNAQLSQQCTHYEHELRKEDAALNSDANNNTNNSTLCISNGASASRADSSADLVRMRLWYFRVNGNACGLNNSIVNNKNTNNNHSLTSNGSLNSNSVDRRSDRLRKQREHLEMAGGTVTLANELQNHNNYNNNNNNSNVGQNYEQQNGYYRQDGKLTCSTATTSAAQSSEQEQQQENEKQKAPWRNFDKSAINQQTQQNNWKRYNGYDNADGVSPPPSERPNGSPSLNGSNNNLHRYFENKDNGNSESATLERARPPPKISLYDDVPNGSDASVVDDTENEKISDNGELPVESRQNVKAPPPCIPTNIFSPTETKTMEFPETGAGVASPAAAAAIASPLLPPPQQQTKSSAVVPVDSDDEANGVGCAGGFAAMLQKRAKKMENSAFRRGITENMNRQPESEIKWKEAAEKLKEKPMIINDLDFSGFVEFEQDPLVLVKVAQVAQDRVPVNGGVPPAPPPISNARGVPPPPPPSFGSGAANGLRGNAAGNGKLDSSASTNASCGTLKLHWKPAHADAPPIPALKQKGTFWNQMEITPQIDISKLSRLFEQKPKELPIKKAGGESKPQLLQVLSVKRSQAINIGLTKLPPISVIPPAIKKFDASVLNKEGIEKILSTMMPSVEEVERIREAQAENPSTPLGQAEQFMLSLSEIDCLLERLRLWLFMLDYHNLEKDVAEALMELNNAMKEIEESKTFRVAMGMLLTIGNALNGTEIKAFQLDYLGRASEVKDPVHKYPLTHHLAEYMLDHYPDGTDLYSELGAVSRSSRLDFDAILDNLKKMETDCKACFDYVAKISQRDNNSSMKNKVNVFLTEVAERIHRLKHVQRTTTHRWNAFLLYFGYAPAEVKEQKPISVFKMVIEFALEYRTNRDKILQMRKRMAEKRERNKTRGMMIGVAQASAASNGGSAGAISGVEGVPTSANVRRQRGVVKTGDNSALMTDHERHQEMSRLLTNGDDTSTLNRRRASQLTGAQAEAVRKMPATTGNSGSAAAVDGIGDDELLDGVVRTVTAQADTRDHNRRRARLFNRKSLRRTRTIRHDQLTELSTLTSNYT